MSTYEGQKVYVGIHCISYAGWVCMFDDFYVGPAEDGAAVNVGNVLSYEVFLDGVSKGTTQTASFDLTGVTPGTHTVGIEARYESGVSERAEYSFTTDAGVEDVVSAGTLAYGVEGGIRIKPGVGANVKVFSVAGQLVADSYVESECTLNVPAGLYIVRVGEKAYKVSAK